MRSAAWNIGSKIFTFLFSSCPHELKCNNYNWVVVLQRSKQNCSKMSAARAARLFVPTRPIKFVICGVVTAILGVRAVAQSLISFFSLNTNDSSYVLINILKTLCRLQRKNQLFKAIKTNKALNYLSFRRKLRGRS